MTNNFQYLLNYTAEVLGISLAGVFHHSSSKSVCLFCCINLLTNLINKKFHYFVVSICQRTQISSPQESRTPLLRMKISRTNRYSNGPSCWAYGTRTHNSRTKILRVTITPKPNLKIHIPLSYCHLQSLVLALHVVVDLYLFFKFPWKLSNPQLRYQNIFINVLLLILLEVSPYHVINRTLT